MNDGTDNNPKISGCLEKKGKMKMMGSYKKYWFVLEGRLLLYYRSKDEYEAISPCKGSINLCPPCNVRPCSSAIGVFQIQCRSNSITLRAESQEDQNRWMNAIMSALNQPKNHAKLSHFRYSLNELADQKPLRGMLTCNHTAPTDECPHNQTLEPNLEIIHRLQKMGAQSYSAKAETLSKLPNSRKHFYDFDQSLSAVSLRKGVLKENDRYEGLGKKMENTSAENIYERISSDSCFTNRSSYTICQVHNSNTEEKKDVIYDIPGPSGDELLRKSREENLNRPSTILLENETYTTTPRRRENKENPNRATSFLLENDQYRSTDKINVADTDSNEQELIDHNENFMCSNDQDKTTGEENAYSIIQLYDSVKNVGNDPNEYEYLNTYAELEPNAEENLQDNHNKNEKGKKKKKQKKDKINSNTKEVKLKKSSSFIRRMWKRKSKHREAKVEEQMYETVPAAVVDKLSMNDNGTLIQVLSELHSILENKKARLVEQLDNLTLAENEAGKIEIENTALSKNSTYSSSNEKLENKESNTTGHLPSDKEETADLRKLEENLDGKENKTGQSSGSDKAPPLLPPKNQKTNVASPYHDFPKNNQPVFQILPPKKKRDLEKIKSLDQILDDLDKENNEECNKNKVKHLIQQFSEFDFNSNHVILRNNKISESPVKEDIYSDELNRLLEELAKVTCAPILTPGVTSSLVNPSFKDEELLSLLPKHCRRYSEPDYDIPRSHKSLTILPKKKSQDGAIGSTRFFGPILKPSDIGIKFKKSSSEDIPSMTPDSLETDHLEAHMTSQQISEKGNSCTSHDYLKSRNCSACCNKNRENCIKQDFDSITIENDIYAEPKFLYKNNNVKAYDCKGTQNNSYCKTEIVADEEVFADSLEMCIN